MTSRIPILIDTDANNELDDQHALAYAFFNRDVFDVVGVTVNNTPHGGGIEGHFQEAERVMKLCDVQGEIPLHRGAEKNLNDIKPFLDESAFDGKDAVDFIIESAQEDRDEKLVLIPIGKMTNIALALAKEPSIESRIRVVWLGSNYPESGEYNLWSDPDAVNSVIETHVEFELVTVRYQSTTGSTAVSVEGSEIRERMFGVGPEIEPLIGRHGESVATFGDYSISLFEHAGTSPRPLFDVVAVAVVKDPSWGQLTNIPAPTLKGIEWHERPSHSRKIGIWEHFDRDGIIEDFFESCASSS